MKFRSLVIRYYIVDMGRNKILTEYEKGRIDQGFADGKSQREIAILIIRSQAVISRYLRNKEGYGKNFVQ